MIKMTILVDDDIPDILTALARGERKRGQWITDTARSLHNQSQYAGDDLHMIHLIMGSLAGKVKMIDARLSKLELRQAQLPPTGQ